MRRDKTVHRGLSDNIEPAVNVGWLTEHARTIPVVMINGVMMFFQLRPLTPTCPVAVAQT